MEIELVDIKTGLVIFDRGSNKKCSIGNKLTDGRYEINTPGSGVVQFVASPETIIERFTK